MIRYMNLMLGTFYYSCDSDNEGIYYPFVERAYHTQSICRQTN
jgi:hypothetical protein